MFLGWQVIDGASLFPLIIESDRGQDPIIGPKLKPGAGKRIGIQKRQALRAEPVPGNDVARKTGSLVGGGAIARLLGIANELRRVEERIGSEQLAEITLPQGQNRDCLLLQLFLPVLGPFLTE